MNTLQNTYKNKIGSAVLSINTAIVGTQTTFRLTYTVGELGIDESGGLKVLFRTAGDCADPQLSDPTQPDYLKITSSNTEVVFHVDTKSTGFMGKVHERPWSRGVSVTVVNQYLSKGDEVYFDFVNWRTQTFSEDKFVFKIVVDPFASGRCIDLPNQPFFHLKPDVLHRLVVIAPSQAKIGKKTSFLVKAEDQWGNPVTDYPAIVELNVVSKKVALKKGRALVSFYPKKEGVLKILGKCNTQIAQSNPIFVQKEIEKKIFWADLHGQSSETIGTNDIESYFKFARDYSFLDVTSTQCNDFQITNKFWKKINRVTKKIQKNGTFIAFPGYEWSGNTNRGGDRNVIHLNEGENIFRSSHALLDNFEDVENDAKNATELHLKLNPKRTLVIPHVGGRYADLRIHDPKLEPVVEIHSAWGTFEWFYFDALKKGYKVGVVANSDDHSGRLGASYPAYDHFNSYGGLTGIFADTLERKSIFTALKKRHCFATTGIRPLVSYTITNQKREKAYMGDDISVNSNTVAIDFKYCGTSPVEQVEIFAFDRVIHTHTLNEKSETKFLKVLCSGSKVKGRARKQEWNGSMNFERAKIVSAEKINFYSKKNQFKQTSDEVKWVGQTTGGVQGFIVELDELSGVASLKINDHQKVLKLTDLSMKPIMKKVGGFDAKFGYYLTSARKATDQVKLSVDVTLEAFQEKSIPLFIKVTQRDGHMVWTSPIFVSK